MGSYILEPRVRETSQSTGTGDLALDGPMYGSLRFGNVLLNAGDSCDVVISYADQFEECVATLSGTFPNYSLARGAVHRSKHSDGTVDQTHVNFPAGIKTIIMTVGSKRYLAFQLYGLRTDVPQAFDNTQKAQGQANLGLFPAGTRMLFQQTAAPTGWTKDSSLNDKALRVVSGTVGAGGSVGFSTLFGRTSTDALTLTAANIPSLSTTVTISAGQSSHGHGIHYDATGVADATDKFVMSHVNPGGASGGQLSDQTALSALSGAGAYSNGATSFAMGLDMRVAYVDVIVAQKDW